MIEIIVGNVGTVYNGNDADEALEKYRAYVEMSKYIPGKAFEEDVTMIVQGAVYLEHIAEIWMDEVSESPKEYRNPNSLF